jgi:hypothetical protein
VMVIRSALSGPLDDCSFPILQAMQDAADRLQFRWGSASCQPLGVTGQIE